MAQEVEWSSTNWKVCRLSREASLGKIPNSSQCHSISVRVCMWMVSGPDEQVVPCRQPMPLVCVNGSVLTCVGEHCESSAVTGEFPWCGINKAHLVFYTFHSMYWRTFVMKKNRVWSSVAKLCLQELTVSEVVWVPEATNVKLQEKPWEEERRGEESGQREGVKLNG